MEVVDWHECQKVKLPTLDIGIEDYDGVSAGNCGCEVYTLA